MPHTLRLALVTTNAHKIRETQLCLSLLMADLNQPIEVMGIAPLVDVEEDGATFDDNALIKLKAVLHNPPTGLDDVDWVMAEDSGLVVPCLDGQWGMSPFPGVRSDRWLDDPAHQQALLGSTPQPLTYTHKNAALLALMSSIPADQRQAYYHTSLAVWRKADRGTQVYQGQMFLWVATASLGTEGFGYDPIMIPQGEGPSGRSNGQLSPEEKAQISHRSSALKAWLKAETLLIRQ